MKVYFDESGQTGCVIKKEELLNFRNSPSFALAAVEVDEKQKELLEKKYLKFKNCFSIKGEIKGTDLLTRNNNDKLEYFINNILNCINISINIYDKRFYLSTLLLFSFCGLECLENFKLDIYTQASILAKQEDDFFIEYLNCVENPNVENFHNYLEYLIKYDYKYFKNSDNSVIENVLVVFSNKILEYNQEALFVDDFMTYGWYKDDNIINLINLNCLCELIYMIKKNIKKQRKITFIHDKISEFEDVIKSEMMQCNYEIQFKDSKDELLLQIADNVVSIFRHCYDKSISYCANKKMWDKTSCWDLKMFSIIQRIIGINRIKYTVPLSDYAVSLCIKDMFSSNYPIKNRNNLYYNLIYQKYMNLISSELFLNKDSLNDVYEVLKD